MDLGGSHGPSPLVPAGPAPVPALVGERRVTRAEAVLPPAPASVATARRIVREACERAGAGADLRDTVVLLTSEVVTNAFTHGRSEARLRVEASASGVRVEVGDDNSRHPALQADDPLALDGRGLRILDVAASRWGVVEDAVGKTVWFALDAG